ncbi:Inner membrane protein YhaI [Defluviimonas aquaemixtae]|uniref:Inner membrane protein YhaI n=1 Tax=Albidovulum aquaemixtae TaxID=1542388 RepID=A0A2R8BJC7_9RHOB|nr:DUF805 domain-containing protein [Defluviimonas aquaemixtae]SPH23400.1 Inner membrane protein YhaI [Defluviimonas aquaemixtae]
MDIKTAVRTCFQKYATFTGRARRAEFWWFALFNLIVNAVLNVIDGVFFGFGHGMMAGPQPLSSLYSLGVLLPSLAVGARRLHDTGRSGWWLLIWLIPIIGWILLIWWFATEGDKGQNGYGDDPLEEGYGKSSMPRVPRQ